MDTKASDVVVYIDAGSSFGLKFTLRKEVLFHWNAPQDKSFQDFKSALINAPALAFPDYSVPFSLYSDASALGFGAVLMQPDARGMPVVL